MEASQATTRVPAVEHKTAATRASMDVVRERAEHGPYSRFERGCRQSGRRDRGGRRPGCGSRDARESVLRR